MDRCNTPFQSTENSSLAKTEQFKEKIAKLEAENEAALKQAESVGREYDRLMEEMRKLQEEKGIVSEKKDD